MKKILTTIYVIAIAAYSIYAVNAEMQPALCWMNLFAPNAGDTYPVVLVGLLTMLTFMLPFALFLVITRYIRKKNEKPQQVDGPGIWIIRKRQLHSALVEIPIYVNDIKIGNIDAGSIKFFEAPVGQNTVNAGKGIMASEKAAFTCTTNEQTYFKLEISQKGLMTKYVLCPLANGDSTLK
jgi:hypothetical protein